MSSLYLRLSSLHFASRQKYKIISVCNLVSFSFFHCSMFFIALSLKIITQNNEIRKFCECSYDIIIILLMAI